VDKLRLKYTKKTIGLNTRSKSTTKNMVSLDVQRRILHPLPSLNKHRFDTLEPKLHDGTHKELVGLVRASLHTHPKGVDELRRDIQLTCSKYGAHQWLENAVKCTGNELGADVMVLDAWTLREICEPWIQNVRGARWSTYPTKEAAQTAQEEDEEEEEFTDDEEESFDQDKSNKQFPWSNGSSPGLRIVFNTHPHKEETAAQTLAQRLTKGFKGLFATEHKQPRIVYVRDASLLVQTRFGATVLHAMLEAARQLRDQPVHALSVCILAGVGPNVMSPDNTQWRHDPSGILAKRFHALETFPTTDHPDAFAHDIATAIQDINRHNLVQQCKKRGFPLLETPFYHVPGIDTAVWPEHKVERVASLAIGLAAQHDTPDIVVSERDIVKSASIVQDNMDYEAKLPDTTFKSGRKRLQPSDVSKYEARLLPCVIDPTSISTRFTDICTNPNTVDTLQTLITLPILHPQYFERGILGKHALTGVLLFGPPGTGKTMLARAVAKESHSAVIEIKGSDVYDKYVGEGEKNVKAIFALARRLSPCVVFIDEVDALFAARQGESAASRREIINQFMTEWDGLSVSKNRGVTIMAATNRPFDLDDAVLRRLPRRILVDLPNEEARRRILELHLQDEVLASDVDMAQLASKTALYSGSDIKSVCVAAVLSAVREQVLQGTTVTLDGSRVIDKRHVDQALLSIGPSCSDEMRSLVELRQWDKKFGEGSRLTGRKLSMGFQSIHHS
jgi:adenylate kinase family enzyme